jgi:hypothetical protein
VLAIQIIHVLQKWRFVDFSNPRFPKKASSFCQFYHYPNQVGGFAALKIFGF